jgi:cation diffusion facilitator CzcD-associated flavoprotein CzcO
VPHVPDFGGDFAGPSWHSARWDHSVELAGKRVAVIGSGASAIQIVPEVAKAAGALHVFQRTPPWILPRKDRPYTRAERRLFAASSLARRAYRASIFWRQETLWPAFKPGTPLSKVVTTMAARNLETHVPYPALRARLTPSYPIGCKRVLVSDDYYPAFARPGVELVTEPIDRLVPEGIRTADGRVRELDAIVFATGFDSQSLVAPMEVVSPAGETLDERWAAGPEAHRGLTVAGFPNFFLLWGPNTNLGHNSVIYMLEAQFDYVLGLLDAARRCGARTVDVRPEAMARWNASLQDQLRGSVWNAGCTNWYKTDGGKITNNWYGPAVKYRWETRRPDLAEYALA